jgi:protein gp37
VEDKKYGLPRVEHLRATPAAVKFLSIEPLLEDLGHFDISGLDWAIIGGESGHGARPMKEAWVEKILKLCRKANVAFFFKQWGGVHKSTTGRLLHGRTYDEMPKLSAADIPLRKKRQSAALTWQNRANIWLSPPTHKILVPLQAAGA